MPQLERAAYQQQVLHEIGWGEMSAYEERYSRQADAPQIDKDHSLGRLDAAELQETERRITLGRTEDAAMEVTHRAWAYEQARGQSAWRRYRIVDQSTGLAREVSRHDVGQRAVARSARFADEQHPVSASERTERRGEQYAREMSADESTLKSLAAAHSEELRRLKSDLDRASTAHRRLAPQAQEIETTYHAESRETPQPIISHERLGELHEQAIERRDVAQIERLEEIRQSLPVESGDSALDEHAVARLQSQCFTADTNREVSRKRLEDFERSHHLRRWEVNGERWSHAELDRHIARQEKAADYNDKRDAADKRHLLSAIVSNSPMRLIRSSEYNVRSDAAQAMAARARAEVMRLQPIREEVVKLTEGHRAKLNAELVTDTRLAEALSGMEAHEREMRVAQGRNMPAPAFSEKELHRIEANAASLCDAGLLKQQQVFVQQGATSEQTVLEKLAARSFAREAMAGITLSENAARLARFEEHREDIPLLYTGADGQEKTGTLREFEPHSWSDRMGRYFSETSEHRAEYAAARASAAERHQMMIEDYSAAQNYYQAAREIAGSYRQQLTEQGRELPAPHFTAKEVAAIETYAAKQTDEGLRASYEEMVRLALAENRVGYAQTGQSEQGMSEGIQKAETMLENNRLPSEQDVQNAIQTPFDAVAVADKVSDDGNNLKQITRGVGVNL